MAQVRGVGKAQMRAIANQKLVETVNSLHPDIFVSEYITQQRLEDVQLELVELLDENVRLNFVYADALRAKDQMYILEACFKLIEESSAADYKASEVKWSAARKRREMLLPDMKYLVISNFPTHQTDQPAEVLGFVSFMITYEDGYEVIYVYEIHIANRLRGKGVGSVLMKEIKNIGQRVGVEKCMLTVFRSNKQAVRWYGRLGYTQDDFSPAPRVLRNGAVKEPSYTILSKSLRTR